MEDGLIHEEDVIAGLDFEEVEAKNKQEAFNITLQMMKEGVDLIYQGVLIVDNRIGMPDLLKKVKGESIFGKYQYIPKDIKSGKSLKEEYVLQVMMYADLLKEIQGSRPEIGVIINVENEELEFSTESRLKKYKEAKELVEQTVIGKEQEPALNSFCKECVWQRNCLPKMQEELDLTLVYKLSRKHKGLLKASGIKNLKQLAKADPGALTELKGVGEKTANRWVAQAQAIVTNKPIILSKPRFRKTKTEIHFDIEGETELGVDYLYGLLIRTDGKEEFKYFWSDKPEAEDKMWKEFCSFIEKVEDPVIYYYSPYEKTSIKRMKERYGCKEEVWEKLQKNMVDLMKTVSQSVILPITSYSIKPIAKYLGFKWRESKAGGAQSMFWYAEYLKGDKQLKQTILEYNEDDVYATAVLKDWLESL